MSKAGQHQVKPGDRRPRDRRNPQPLRAVLLALALTGAPLAVADAVKLGSFWHENARVVGFEGDRIVFINEQGREIREPMDRLEALRVDAAPDLQKGLDALAAGDAAQAATLLGRAARQATDRWLQQYATWKQVQALDAAGRALAAVDAYIDLLGLEPAPAMRATPPIASVSAAPDAVKAQVRDRVAQTLRRAEAAAREPLQQIAAAAQPGASAATPDAPQQAAAPVAPGDSAIALSSDLRDGPIVADLRRGAFDAALRQTSAALQASTGTMSRDLYLHGLAQLGLAEQSGDERAYKDAGLSFMRVVTYFPRSRYAAPAWLEAGYVHQKIGRPEIAARLYERAAAMLDPDTDPVLAARAATLQQSLPAESNTPSTPSE